MNKNFKCVIFDLDGTLINSGPDLLNSLNYVLAQNNLEKIDKNIPVIASQAASKLVRQIGFVKIETLKPFFSRYIDKLIRILNNNV